MRHPSRLNSVSQKRSERDCPCCKGDLYMQKDRIVERDIRKFALDGGNSEGCLWDNVPPGKPMLMVCFCPKCSPRC